MKIKLLATLASVLLAGSMLAQNPFTAEGLSVRNLDGISPKNASEIVKAKPQTKTQEPSLKKNTARRVTTMQKVSELDGSPVKTLANGDVYTIEGKYTLYIDDCYFQGGAGYTSFPVTISYDARNSRYIMSDDTDNWFVSDVPFTFSNNRMTIRQVNFSDMLFTTHIYNWSSQKTVQQSSMSVPFDPNTGTFTFPSDTGFGWWQYNLWGDFTGNFYNIFDVLRGVHQGQPTIPSTETWNDAGTAVFVDGWVLPAFSEDVTDVKNWYEVPLQQDANNSKRYRLVDPYHCNPNFKTGNNTSTTKGYINFNISDPDHVVFETGVDAGWANREAGVTTFYCYNQLGWYMGFYDVPASTVIDQLGDQIPYTTYKNGVVSLDYIIDGREKIYDATFGYQDDPLAGFYWPGDLSARIIMPGGKAVGIANSTVKASDVSDKTATISFDFKTFNLAASDKVTATVTNGRLFTQTFEIDGTHADVTLEGLTPSTLYNMTLTLDAKSGNSTVATSFPATVSFTTAEEIIVVPEKEVEKYTLTLAVGQKVNPAAYLLNAQPTAWASDDDAVADIDGTDIVGHAFGNTIVTGNDADGDAVAQLDVNVCPMLTVLYPEGATLTYNVIYGARADVAISPLDGWKVNSLALDGIDVTADFADGRYLSAEPLSADATLVVVTEAQDNTTTYKVFVDGSSVKVDNADITAVTVRYIHSDIEIYSGTLDALSLEPGAYTIELTDASGVVSSFRVVLK